MSPSKSERTRQLILDTAAQELSRGRQVTLNDIAEAAGIGRATLHRHFKSRDDLMIELTKTALKETDEACKPAMESASNAREALENMFEAIIPLGFRYSFLSQEMSVMSDPVIKAAYAEQLKAIDQMVEGLKTEGYIAPDVPNAWITHTIDSLIYAAWSSVENGYVARRDAGRLAVRTILDGLSPKEE